MLRLMAPTFCMMTNNYFISWVITMAIIVINHYMAVMPMKGTKEKMTADMNARAPIKMTMMRSIIMRVMPIDRRIV